ncbi:MAG: malto-oligosyltrehalose synthase [Candidatus Competibacteraceae bacterium]
MTDTQRLDRLCALYGIAAEYTDAWNKKHSVPLETRLALLRAMGVNVTEQTDLQAELEEAEARPWRRLLAPVVVVRETMGGAPQIAVHVPADQAEHDWEWTLTLENGERQGGRFRPCDLELLEERDVDRIALRRYGFSLPFMPWCGYHQVSLALLGQSEQATTLRLIVVPDQCYRPPVLAAGNRIWGPVIQLYALRSHQNWGIGDFGDLRRLLDEAVELGANVVGLNPLHALFPAYPTHASPYSPSSRLFYNPLYLHVEGVSEFADCQTARQTVEDPLFQARLRALRNSELVDYDEIAAAKWPILEQLFREFQEHHAAGPRGAAFEEFRARHGETLRRQALFEALQEHFQQQEPGLKGWLDWPEPYRDPNSEACAAFAEAHQERVEFYEYLQWQLSQQLDAVGKHSMALGLGVGIYQDLAVSISRSGAEAWGNQSLYALTASIGAPPDTFNPAGQNWDLPPLIPHRLQETAYAPFIAMLRENMRHAGGLRIDHVMGLLRLYWVPAGSSPKDGTYISYPFDDLLNILILESQRNRCLVIGEDLGTVPDSLRDALAERGVLSYRLLYFESNPDGSYKHPEDYPEQALVAIGTHDLPTLGGYWQGVDLELRDGLNLLASQEVRDAMIVERAQNRAWLRMALEREELLPADVNVHTVSAPELKPELMLAIHLYVARSPAQIMMVQPEDVFGQVEQFNVPGTTDQYPNWRHKLKVNLEDWTSEPGFVALTQALRQERGVPEQPLVAPPRQPPQARIPDATYRFQFNSAFTFAQAAELVPYLNSLGVSHCYASPYLRARPGSSHGYDIIDHNALNPEIGDNNAYDRFCEILHQHGMGQILDMVPNHMGVMGSDNAWWLDMLENGPAALHAPFFDIDWQPLPEGLRGKVLLPVLGDHYGVVLENGELQLDFDWEAGAFSVQYYEHRFPIDPGTYPGILGHGMEQLEACLGATHLQFLEYQSLVTAFGHLPARNDTTLDKIAERNRDKEIHKRHLLQLCKECPDIHWFVEEKLKLFNGTPGEPESFDALHELLQDQAYRLAFWRVASDDINYRRFFDINDLAGLRMENETVFRETHRFVMELIAAGKIDGLRIDHPDGLYDPAHYFQSLQECLVTPSQARKDDVAAPLPLYVVVEKILESYERLPEQWPVHGTTGYEFANLVNGLLVNGVAEEKFNSLYASFIDKHIDFEDLLYHCKKLIMQTALASELNVLANQLNRIAMANRRTQDYTLNGLKGALTEVVACFPVYRTYITAAGVADEDKRYIDWAVSVAQKRSQAADVTIFDFVRAVLLTTEAEGKPDTFRKQVLAFAMKFQQYTGPLMAKGLEDTSFYRYNRLASLNEVGGDPRRFAVSISGFHHANQDRARHWPRHAQHLDSRQQTVGRRTGAD